MSKIPFNKKKITIIATLISTAISVNIYSQHLFSIEQNKLSHEETIYLKSQISHLEINPLSLTKSNGNKDVYSFGFSSVENSKIIILNEENGNNVVISKMEPAIEQFIMPSFFIEELKYSTLGAANRYLLAEVSSDFSVKNVLSVSCDNEKIFLPRFFYGKKENFKEALPQDRKIIKIFKEKPKFIPAFPDDPENIRLIEQLEEEWSYYVYMYKLPDGTLTVYDEHFNKDDKQNETRFGTSLQFNLTGNQNSTQLEATLYALELWSQLLAGTIPVDIRIDFVPMGSGVIGASFRTPNYLIDETYYPSPLANQLLEYNFAPNQRDIRLMMNSDFNFYYGITGNPGYNQIDWITVMLHEVTHGLGFYSLLYRDNSNPMYNGSFVYMDVDGNMYTTEYPGTYDRQLFQGLEGPCVTELEQSERAALMTSNNVYSGAYDSYLLEANEGIRVKIYAPSSYASGSSLSHWDSSVSFPTFMKYAISYGYKLHNIGTRKIGILYDLGWTPAIINPYKPVKNLEAEIIDNNAVISWEEPEPSDVPETLECYIIYRLLQGEPESEWITLSDNYTQLTYTDNDWNLLQGGYYQYAVIAKYSDDNLSDVRFTNPLIKLCDPLSIFPYNESFENSDNKIPDCWTQEYVAGNADWEVIPGIDGIPSPAQEGDYIIRLFYETWNDSQITKLVMPPMDLSDLNNPILTFWHAQRDWYNDLDRLKIFYKTSVNSEWILLRSYQNEVYDWTQRTIALPNGTDNYFIAFEGEANYGWGVQLDDISINDSEFEECPFGVSNLTVTINNTSRYASLNWEAPDNDQYGSFNIYLDGFLIASGIESKTYQYRVPVSIDESHDWCITVDCLSGFEGNAVCYQTEPSLLISVEANPINGGNPTGGGLYQPGSTAIVSANPRTGWNFINWTIDDIEVSTQLTYSFAVTYNATLIANYGEVGINKSEKEHGFSIYPNPAKDILIVESYAPDKTLIEIYNIVGLLVHNQYMNNKTTEIDVSKLSSGIYLIKFQNNKGTAVKMFVKE